MFWLHLTRSDGTPFSVNFTMVESFTPFGNQGTKIWFQGEDQWIEAKEAYEDIKAKVRGESI